MTTTLSQKKFSKSMRLLRSSAFRRLRHDSIRCYGQLLGFQYRQGNSPSPRLGITVSKKYGKSHERNRFKRCVREAFRHVQSELPAGIEINVFPQRNPPYPTTEKALLDFQQLIINNLRVEVL